MARKWPLEFCRKCRHHRTRNKLGVCESCRRDKYLKDHSSAPRDDLVAQSLGPEKHDREMRILAYQQRASAKKPLFIEE